MNLKFVERIYKLDEVLEADEALITASSIYVLPVSKIDDHVIADGQAGRFTIALRKAYLETARAEFYQPTDKLTSKFCLAQQIASPEIPRLMP